jgi:hypothetical protein
MRRNKAEGPAKPRHGCVNYRGVSTREAKPGVRTVVDAALLSTNPTSVSLHCDNLSQVATTDVSGAPHGATWLRETSRLEPNASSLFPAIKNILCSVSLSFDQIKSEYTPPPPRVRKPREKIWRS